LRRGIATDFIVNLGSEFEIEIMNRLRVGLWNDSKDARFDCIPSEALRVGQRIQAWPAAPEFLLRICCRIGGFDLNFARPSCNFARWPTFK
jgi:hypothetical protein